MLTLPPGPYGQVTSGNTPGGGRTVDPTAFAAQLGGLPMDEAFLQIATSLASNSAKLDALAEDVGHIANRHTRIHDDHEARLRRLEQWRYAVPVSAFGFAATVIVSIVK